MSRLITAILCSMLLVSSAVAQTTTAPPKPAAPDATKAAPIPAGIGDTVWLNTKSNVYHCFGTQYYGKTKAGEYMTEAEAKAKGAHGVQGKACKPA